ncbi:MAG TPA: PaaI family thioesterase [Clostridia bacterium]|nr:PaaI family thioesterase [Clostridia bacterium]
MDDVREYFAKDQFATSIGIKLLEVRPGYAVSEMEITEQHLNALKIVQGGAVFTLADYTFAAASNAYGQVVVAVNGSITYFQVAQGKKLIAEATEVSVQNRLVTYNVDVFDEHKALIARFTGLGYKKKEAIK